MMNQVKLEMQTHLNKITDEISDDFLKEIKENPSNIDFGIIEERLKAKYMQEGHSKRNSYNCGSWWKQRTIRD